MSVYKTILIDNDQGTLAPVLVVGVEGDEVFITVAEMNDKDTGTRMKNISPEITVNVTDLLTALGYHVKDGCCD